MAKVPYTQISKKISEGLGSANKNAVNLDCGNEYLVSINDGNDSTESMIRLALKSISKNFRDLPENCADGSCDTVYVPVIIHFHEYNDNYGFVIDVTRQQKYAKVASIFEALNRAFRGEYDATNDLDVELQSVIGHRLPGEDEDPPSHQLNTGVGGAVSYTRHYLRAIKDISYPTNIATYNTDSGGYEEELVPHKDLRELYPNIQFFFPERLKTEYIIEGFYKENTGCKVNFLNLLNTIDNTGLLFSDTRALLDQEYMYFASELPGALFWDSKILDSTFFAKLNTVQQILNSNTNEVNIQSFNINFGSAADGGFGAPSTTGTEGVDWGIIQNFRPNKTTTGGARDLIFSDYTFSINTSRYKSAFSAYGTTTPYSNAIVNLGLDFNQDILPQTLFHEFNHTLGSVHSWTMPTVCGSYLDADSYLNEDGSLKNVGAYQSFPGLNTISGNIPPGESSYNSFMLKEDFKVPFNYSVKDPLYIKRKRLYDKAVQDLNAAVLQDYQSAAIPGITSDSDYEDYIETLEERVAEYSNSLNEVNEFNVGNFLDISDDEKGYIEYLYNTFIPNITNNFNSRTTFINGEFGVSNPEINRSEDYNLSTTSLRLTLEDVIFGISSFWGGSYILKNPPTLNSGDDSNGFVFKIEEQKDIHYFRPTDIPGGDTIIRYSQFSDYNDNPSNLPEGWSLFTVDSLQKFVDSLPDLYPEEESLTDILNIIYPEYEALASSIMGLNSTVFSFWVSTDTTLSANEIGTQGSYVLISDDGALIQSGVNINNLSLICPLHKVHDALEDDSIAKQLVVNPANDDGTRKGPDVTTHIPFCDIDDDNKYDPYWMHNFNAWNSNYTEYPNNTPVEDLMHEDYCPCLHQTQVYHAIDNSYEFKIIGGGSYAWAAHAVMHNTFADTQIDSFTSSISEVNTGLNSRSNTSVDPDDYTDKIDFNYGLWLSNTTNRYKDGYDNSALYTIGNITDIALYRYSDSESTVLNLPIFNGYCGFGWGSVLPKAIELDKQKFTEFSNEENEYILTIPSEFNLLNTGNAFDTDLRLGHRGPSATTTDDNIRSRYDVGGEDNPLYQYRSKVLSLSADPVTVSETFENGFPLTADVLDYTREPVPDNGYFSDLYGEYNHFNFNQVLHYRKSNNNTALNTKTVYMPTARVRAANYYFNDTNVDLVNNYFVVHTEHQEYIEEVIEEEEEVAALLTLPQVGDIITEGGMVIEINADGSGVVALWGTKGNTEGDWVPLSEGETYANLLETSNRVPEGSTVVPTENYVYYPDIRGRTTEPLLTMSNMIGALTQNGYDDWRVPSRAELISLNTTSGWDADNKAFLRASWSKYICHIDDTLKRIDLFDIPAYAASSPPASPARGRPVRDFQLDLSLYEGEAGASSRAVSRNVNTVISQFEELYILIADHFTTDFDLEYNVGGCNDPDAFNYDPNATYNNGTCVDRVYGCMQSWSDNYAIVDDDGNEINTDDGSCYTTICTNPEATGDYGAGYNLDLVNTVNAYAVTYNETALIEAVDGFTTELNEENYEECQFTSIPRNSIIRLVCVPSDELDTESSPEVCNYNPDITFIRDRSTKDISNYTSDPEQVSLPFLDFIRTNAADTSSEDIQSKVKLLNHIVYGDNSLLESNDWLQSGFNISTTLGNSFPSNDITDNIDTMGEEISNNPEHRIKQIIRDFILEGSFNSSAAGLQYNCVENPILPDGTGGCFLYAPSLGEANDSDLIAKFKACSVGQIQTASAYGCTSELVFEGGFIESDEFISNLAAYQAGTGCSEGGETPTTFYIIGGDLASEYADVEQQNGVIINVLNLPVYSSTQLSSVVGVGYSEEVLDLNLISVRNSISFRTGNPISTAISRNCNNTISNPFPNSFEGYLYFEDGSVYNGAEWAIEFNDCSNVFTKYSYNTPDNTNQKLYYRNEILRGSNFNVALTDKESLAKKMSKVINKIINLPIFTDN